MNRTSFCGQFFENLLHLAAARDREIHATRLAVDVAELQACLADGRVVHNREKSRRVRHDGSVEEGLVMVEQIDEVDVAIEVRVLLAELHHHASQLQFLGLRYVGYEANQAECLLFGLGEGGRLVERWIAEQFDSALGDVLVIVHPPAVLATPISPTGSPRTA